MKLFKLFKNFKKDEDGAVTVDWVVLTAAIVGLGIVVMNVVGGQLKTTATSLAKNINSSVTGSANGTSTTYNN